MRQLLPILLALGLFAMGAWALSRLIGTVNPQAVMAEARQMPWTTLAGAVLATAVGYLALIGYDWWALRYIGRRLNLRVVALGSFLGSAFGNTVGMSAISGGAVRYRIYSALGLTAFEVAAVSTYIAVAMGLGLTMIGYLALIFDPGALGKLLPLPPDLVRWTAAGLALVSGGIVLALSLTGRSLTVWRLRFEMPPPGILGGQLAVSLLDVMAASFALWLLLPEGKPDFPSFVAIYAASTMLGVLSHVPGGVGVFETAVLAAMPPDAPVTETAAALLMFRGIYYLLPFGIAFLLVSVNEARAAGGAAGRMLGHRSAALRPVFGAFAGLVPALVAVVAFGFGALLIAVALIPSVRAEAIEEGELISAVLREGGTLVAAVSGVVLLILSHGLLRRVEAAFWMTLAALSAGSVAALIGIPDWESGLLLAAGALAILPFRSAFYRHAKLTEGVFSPMWFALVLAVVLTAGSFFYLAHEAMPYVGEVFWDFSSSAGTPRALRAGILASALLLTFSVFLSLRPARHPARAMPDADEMTRAAAIVAAQDRPYACLALTGDKSFVFSGDGAAMLMYGRHRATWAAFGDPVGEARGCAEAAWRFFDEARRANCHPVFYEVGTDNLPLWVEMGMSLHKIGEEAIVRLADFSLEGARFKSMRAAHNKALRSGLVFEVHAPPHSDTLIAEAAEVSALWLDGKTGREKRFSVGRFERDYLDRFPIATVRRDGRLLAFANILAPGSGAHVAIDLMRYRPEEAGGMMEFLFLCLIAHYRAAGADTLSLGTAPLSGLPERPTARLWSSMGQMIFRHGGAFYNFEGLRAFKQKFRPDWQPRYLALPPGVMPVVALADVALLISGGSRGIIGKERRSRQAPASTPGA